MMTSDNMKMLFDAVKMEASVHLLSSPYFYEVGWYMYL